MARITFPLEDDSVDPNSYPNVIIVDGTCYIRDGFVSIPEENISNEWEDVDEEFDTCEDCDGSNPCQGVFEAEYDCDLEEWTVDPFKVEEECSEWGVCIERGWYLFEVDENILTYRALICDKKEDPVCETPGDPCNVPISLLPDLPLFPLCDTPQSSSSSAIQESSSSSSSESSSSSSIQKDLDGPRFI
jgi:hypothetical protein